MSKPAITAIHERSHTEPKIQSETTPSPASTPLDDEDARAFEDLIGSIAELRDPDTLVEHIDAETYRKGKSHD